MRLIRSRAYQMAYEMVKTARSCEEYDYLRQVMLYCFNRGML